MRTTKVRRLHQPSTLAGRADDLLRRVAFRLGIRIRRRRRMTREQMREIARMVAKDPEVDSAVNEFLAEHPEFRMKDRIPRALQDSPEP